VSGPSQFRTTPGSAPVPRPGPPGGIDSAPDPWGVRRAENLLTSLEGVLSARVVTTPLGEVSEVHVLAQLGLKIDHRKISVAQTADVRPIEALEAGAARERSMHRAALFEKLEVAPGRRPHRVIIRVTLSFMGKTETAEEESSDTPKSKVDAAARAAVTVLDALLSDHSVALEGAKIVEAFEKEFVMVAVQGLGGREALLLIGTAEIKESAERAAVFAVLDGTNRWAEARRQG